MLMSIKNLIKNLTDKIGGLKSPLTKEEKDLLYDLCMHYEVNDEVCNEYRTQVKNNKNITYCTIKCKLIRNIILGKLICQFNEDGTDYKFKGYRYGNLEIHINTESKEIFFIKNRVDKWDYYIDENKKKWLYKKLGLEK